MRIITWNVNGLRSVINKGFKKVVEELSADIICIQETKITSEMKDFKLEGYYNYFNYSKKGGYSGVAIFSKEKAEDVRLGIELEDEEDNIDYESRVITVEYNDFFVVSVYVPCSQSNQERTNYRMEFDYNFNEYIEKLNQRKDVIICGDFNVCHKNIDICNLDKHKSLEVFSDEERANFKELLELGFIDTYRYMHPQMRKYTFWTNAVDRTKNEYGWRLDYILVSEYLKKNIREANILTEIEGSDHCPVELVIKI
ncbi:MAG: exodeoxyribonuclease III [Clostridiales bacterium]|nr:exodeoxyribonuclease III [Clostridiales bacterium]